MVSENAEPEVIDEDTTATPSNVRWQEELNRMDAMALYAKTYRDMNFERRGLFALIQRKFPADKVVYPGCGTHITPSFYFHHVLYIDRSQKAVDFFADTAGVRRLIDGNKVYRKSSYFSFSYEDFMKVRERVEYKYDLLLSLYAEDVIDHCLDRLNQGGIAVSNNFHDEVVRVMKDGRMELIGAINAKNDCYTYSSDRALKVGHRDEEKVQKRCMKKNAGGICYVDHEIYYVLRKK